MGAPRNLQLFIDPIGLFGPPGGHFGFLSFSWIPLVAIFDFGSGAVLQVVRECPQGDYLRSIPCVTV